MSKHFSYFDHEADIGIAGSGDTIEAAFEAAAEATFAIMTDLAAVRPERRIRFAFQEPDVEFALVTWLNRLLAEARSEGMILGRFQIVRDGADWSGEAWGEPWRPELDRGTEVKGATLTMLAVRATADGWEARCVVDV
jgi:SHS2 domain-containing protein